MAVAANAAPAKDVEQLDVWMFERISYENRPVVSDFRDCAGLLPKYAIIDNEFERLRDGTLAKDIEGLRIDLSLNIYPKEDNYPKVENFEKLKFLNVLEASCIRLHRIRKLPELQVLICQGCTLQALTGRHRDELAGTSASLPKLRCLVTYDYERTYDSPLLPQGFPITSLRSLVLMRSGTYDYSFLLHFPNLENLHLDLSLSEAHNVLDTLRRLPYKNKLLRFGTIDLHLLQDVQADKLYSTAQDLLDEWPNLRQLSVGLPNYGTKGKILRFPSTIQVLTLRHCGPFKLKALLQHYKQLKFLLVSTDRVDWEDFIILQSCCKTKSLFMGTFKVSTYINYSKFYKYCFILSKRSTEDGSTPVFDYVHENFDTYKH